MVARLHWVSSVEGGPRRVNHAAVCVADTVYSLGGYSSQISFTAPLPMDVHALDTRTLRWRRVAAASAAAGGTPYLRYGHTAVQYGNSAYVWGGRNDCDGASAGLHRFDPREARWHCVRPAGSGAGGGGDAFVPPARDGHSACVSGDQMLVFGGFEEDFQRFSQETFALDFRTGRWAELHAEGRRPAHRDFHTAVCVAGRMYVFGGRSDRHGEYMSNSEEYRDEVNVLHLDEMVWRQPATGGQRPCGRRSHSAWVHEGRMYVFGGYCGLNSEHFGTAHEFDPETSAWRPVQCLGRPAPAARRRHCSVPHAGRLYLFGGTRPRDRSNFSTGDEQSLTDLSDLHVAEFEPSLYSAAMSAVAGDEALSRCAGRLLPRHLVEQLEYRTVPNSIPSRYEG